MSDSLDMRGEVKNYYFLSNILWLSLAVKLQINKEVYLVLKALANCSLSYSFISLTNSCRLLTILTLLANPPTLAPKFHTPPKPVNHQSLKESSMYFKTFNTSKYKILLYITQISKN